MDSEHFDKRGTEGNNNILIWAHSPYESNEQLRTPSFSQRRRASFTDKHPLLAKLEETENDEIKHSDYAAHLIIQQRTREYTYAVEDTITLLKKGSEQILDNIAYWRGFEAPEGTSYTSWIHAAAGTSSSGSNEDITRVGKKVVAISESIRSIHDEDALTFWTCEQRNTILELLVTLSKDMVKLRRKLGRVKDSLNERLRQIRRVAILTECEITGNLVPSEIYYEWVKEDAKSHRATDFGCKNRVSISILEIPSKKRSSSFDKSKGSVFKKVIYSLTSCVQAPVDESDSDRSISLDTTFVSVIEPVGISYQKPSKEKVEVQTLHNRPSQEDVTEDEESVCSESMETMVLKNGPPMDSKGLLEDSWSPKPSQKYLDIITANVAYPQKFSTTSYVYDRNESRIKEDVSHLVDGCVLNSSDVALLDQHKKNENTSSGSLTGQSMKYADEESETEPPKVLTLSNNNPYEGDGEDGDKYEDISGEAAYFSGDEASITSNISSEAGANKILSDSMKQEIHRIIRTGRLMHEIINETTWALRGLERMWLSPPEDLVKSRKNCTRELYKLVDLIVDTARLTQNPAFASRLYPEDKHEIIAVLDPVLREFTNCYMALYVLHSLVTVDVNYLKELLGGFPKGSLVIRDWISDPSLDEDLGGLDQHSTTASDFDIDVEEIFQ